MSGSTTPKCMKPQWMQLLNSVLDDDIITECLRCRSEMLANSVLRKDARGGGAKGKQNRGGGDEM